MKVIQKKAEWCVDNGSDSRAGLRGSSGKVEGLTASTSKRSMLHYSYKMPPGARRTALPPTCW
jgi:hypothetical protein